MTVVVMSFLWAFPSPITMYQTQKKKKQRKASCNFGESLLGYSFARLFFGPRALKPAG